MLPQRLRERIARLDIRSDGPEHVLERDVRLLIREDLKTLNQRQTRIHHHCELTREDDEVVDGHPGREERNDLAQVFRLLFDLAGDETDVLEMKRDGIGGRGL